MFADPGRIPVLSLFISAFKKRPKAIKLFLQTHAGLKNGASLYKSTVLPLFQSADVNVDCVGKFYANLYWLSIVW